MPDTVTPADATAAGPLSAPLSDGDLAAYTRTGWVAARGFFSPDEAAAISRWTDELVAMPEEPGKHMVYYEPSLLDPTKRVVQRIENFCPYHPEFDGLVRHGRLFRAVEQLLGAPSCLFKEKINFKMAGGAGFEPHQDQQAGWSRYAPIFLTVMVSVDRATVENGCLEMADMPRLTGLIGEEWKPLTEAQMASFQLVPVPTEPGDVLFFDSYAPHASKPNLTDKARRILYLTYNRLADGDHRELYFTEKRANFPPDIERQPGKEYKFRV
ncbi:phytanoyl-CoA dioxygenase family protein [Inquilinus limosus]|uniref:phytanoyl-CoA dioxygenase family protein n=1 Tax=Inquilinus limosus TaxID=171674 RepID=UPI003F17CA61